jgi:ATP-binding cassette subfamily F protein uup
MNFDGCLVLVSHDRYFMDKLVDHLFVFEGEGKILDFYGNYTDYRESIENTPIKGKNAPIQKTETPAQKQEKVKKKLSFKEQKEFNDLELEIEKLESRKAELNTLLLSGSNDHDTLNNWSSEIGKINSTLDEKSMRWLELSEM